MSKSKRSPDSIEPDANPESENASSTDSAASRLAPRIAEQRLLEIARTLPGERIFSISIGRGQAAEALAQERPTASVTCWFLDSYHKHLASQHAAPLSNLRWECLADWPEAECDLALLPLHTKGEAELTRDLLQSAYQRLQMGGILMAAVDNPKDKWLHDQLKLFDKSVKVRPFDDAVVYFVKKTTPLKRERNFQCEVVYRDLDRLLTLVTRPGVFSHRELDNGARQLLDAVDVYPESRLLDLGCGSGAVAMGLAARDPMCKVHAVDSSARAVWCTREGARRNQLDNITVELNHDGLIGEPEQFDMVLANPPYYADFQIAERFIESAIRALRPGGRLVMVTKQSKWYEENLHRWLDEAEVFPSRKYFIASGTKIQL